MYPNDASIIFFQNRLTENLLHENISGKVIFFGMKNNKHKGRSLIKPHPQSKFRHLVSDGFFVDIDHVTNS